jgi:hypothetical protein
MSTDDDKITVEHVNVPGYTTWLNVSVYEATKPLRWHRVRWRG